MLGDADILVRSDNNSLMIVFSEMRQLDDGHMSEEPVQILGYGARHEPFYAKHAEVGATM